MLPDVLSIKMKIIFCGAPIGNGQEKGKFYYDSPGDKFWDILHETGLTPVKLKPEDYKFVSLYGLGLTYFNIDREALTAKINKYSPHIFCFNGKKAAKSYLGRRNIEYGFQEDYIGPTSIFVAPSTSVNAGRYWDETWWFLLAASVGPTVKRINPANYYEPDEICKLMKNLDLNTGKTTRTTEKDFIRAINDVELHSSVPLHIRNMFEISKALFAYGYLYYPFCTLAVEQALKCLEAVLSRKYDIKGGPRLNEDGRTTVFRDKIEYLYSAGMISGRQKKILHDFRHLRNISFHPEYQQILGHYDGTLRVLVHLMNEVWLR